MTAVIPPSAAAATIAAAAITQKNILRHELVGLQVLVAEAPNRSMVGLNGRVIDETKYMIVVDVPGRGPKMVPKAGARFIFSRADAPGAAAVTGEIEVDGDQIQKRPFDRA